MLENDASSMFFKVSDVRPFHCQYTFPWTKYCDIWREIEDINLCAYEILNRALNLVTMFAFQYIPDIKVEIEKVCTGIHT